MTAVFVWLAGLVLVVLIWLMFRTGGYKRQPLNYPPGPGWQKTDERFVDPSTGEPLEVWFHPASGERAYVRSRRGAN
jgi:hypothetical protein